MSEEEFSEANKVFAAKCAQLKKDGQLNIFKYLKINCDRCDNEFVVFFQNNV